MDEVLRYENTKAQKAQKKTKNRSKRRSAVSDSAPVAAAASAASDDVYHPVVCSVCNSEVGVYDKDEVYHFFNVLASYA